MVQGALASERYFTPPLCRGPAGRLSRGRREEMGTAASPPGVALGRGPPRRCLFWCVLPGRPRRSARAQGTTFGLRPRAVGRLFIYAAWRASRSDAGRWKLPPGPIWGKIKGGGRGVPNYFSCIFERAFKRAAVVLMASYVLVLGCAASGTGGVSRPWFRWQRPRVPAFLNSEAPARSGLSGVSEIVCPCCRSTAYL